MIEFLISAVRLSRLLPKFISAANNIHFRGSLHFTFLNSRFGSIRPPRIWALPRDSIARFYITLSETERELRLAAAVNNAQLAKGENAEKA
jgi:hypothetical protein